MAEKYSVATLQSIVEAVADVLSVASKVIAGQGFWLLLGLQGAIQSLAAVSLSQAKLELGDVSDDERKQLEAAFAARLDLVNKDVQAKVIAGENCLEEAIVIVESALSVFNNAKDLLARAKALFA